MKRYSILILVVLSIVLCLLAGCGQRTKPTKSLTTNPVSKSVMTGDEVKALIYNYLESRATSITNMSLRMNFLGYLAKARPYSSTKYQGNGKWQIQYIGFQGQIPSGNLTGDGLWNLYETSGVIEPANNEAIQLVYYFQWWTK
jgi:hypothetical protein